MMAQFKIHLSVETIAISISTWELCWDCWNDFNSHPYSMFYVTGQIWFQVNFDLTYVDSNGSSNRRQRKLRINLGKKNSPEISNNILNYKESHFNLHDEKKVWEEVVAH